MIGGPRRARSARGCHAVWGVVGLVVACAGPPNHLGSPVPTRHDRRDYLAFRANHPEIREPNYLPFLAHRLALAEGQGDALVLCRWSDERFPLPVHVTQPRIPVSLQDEFDPKPAALFVEAVEAALAIWERELEGLVRFRRVERARNAALTIRLLARVAPAPKSAVAVLGATRLGHACRLGRGGEVEFEVPELLVYLADEHGLLNPGQVGRVALHEIGHALGMRGHSPVPADLMFAVARDLLAVHGLSEQDINSFVSLYRLPNGTVLAPAIVAPAVLAPGLGAADRLRPPPAPPEGEPELAAALYVDARYGYELRPPAGWMEIETPQGMIAVDGVSWDYDASFQILVRGYPTIQSYLDRYGGHYVGAGRVVERRDLEVAGRPALRLLVKDRVVGMVEELTFIETGDGRVVVVIADCPAPVYPAWRPWFRASLATLAIREFAASGADRR